jgi:exoribonuclease-2
VLLRIQGIDNISLDVHGQLIEVLEDASALTDDNPAQTQQDDDDETPAGPLAIAVDVDEVVTAEAPQP